MRIEYEEYFRGQLSVLPSGTDEPGPITQAVLGRIPTHWRPDAAYFLARNVHDMVVAPYLAVENRSREDLRDALWPPLVADLDEIIWLSEEVAKERKRDYVSATSVAIALGRLAPHLKTTSLQIWGPREND